MIRVSGSSANPPPVITPPEDIELCEGQAFDQSFTPICVDANGDNVIVNASGMPVGMNDFQTSGGGLRFVGTPSVGSAADSPYTVTISCSDGVNPPVNNTMVMTVKAATLEAPANCPFTITGDEGTLIPTVTHGTFTSSAGTIVLTSPDLPAGVNLIDNGAGGWSLSGSFPDNASSPYIYTVNASSGGLNATCSGNMIVSNEVASLAVECDPIDNIVYDISDPATQFGPHGLITGGVPPYNISQSGITDVAISLINNGTNWSWNISPLATVGGPFSYVINVSDNDGDTAQCNGGTIEIVNNGAPASSGTIQSLPSSCQSGAVIRCGAFNLDGSDEICGLPLRSAVFQTGNPAPNPVQGILFIELDNISSISEVGSITIGNATINAADAAITSGNLLTWDNSALTQTQRTEIHSVLSSGQPFDISYTCT